MLHTKNHNYEVYDVAWDLQLSIKYPQAVCRQDSSTYTSDKNYPYELIANRVLRHFLHLLNKSLPENAELEVDAKLCQVKISDEINPETSVSRLELENILNSLEPEEPSSDKQDSSHKA